MPDVLTPEETQALVLRLAAVTKERDQLASVVSELTGFIGEYTMRASPFCEKVQRQIEEVSPARGKARELPSVIYGTSPIDAQAAEWAPQEQERILRAREHGD